MTAPQLPARTAASAAPAAPPRTGTLQRLLFNPAALLVSLLWLVAIWAIMAGILFVIASFYVRKAGNLIVAQTS